jgi:hypothetical protein
VSDAVLAEKMVGGRKYSTISFSDRDGWELTEELPFLAAAQPRHSAPDMTYASVVYIFSSSFET